MELFEIVLNDGAKIAADILYQVRTYDGKVEADNFEFRNKFVMDGMAVVAKEILGDFPVFVVPPDIKKNEDGSEEFPAIRCVAQFSSFVAGPPDDYDHLVMTIIWFQDELFTKMPAHIEAQIKQLDWQRMAAPARS